MVEVLIESKAGKIQRIELRPTHSRFDETGMIDLGYAAEAMAIILGGSKPKRISKNVLRAVRLKSENTSRQICCSGLPR